MRQTKSLTQDEPMPKRNRNVRIKIALTLVLIAASCAVAFVSRAYNQPRRLATLSKEATRLSASHSAPTPALRDLNGRLSLQPEANKQRRQLGQRFTKPGHERATLVGTLTVGVQQFPVRIVRTQNDDGEQVEIALGVGPVLLTWNATEGAKSGASLANGMERLLIERLALDSPDQFVLAQLRGASYYTVAQQAMPEEIASDDYAGPVWDVVRIGERIGSSGARPESLYRLYYINTATGLIEKVFSNEQGRSVVAELSGWTQISGEWVAARTIWRIDKQAAMELNLSNVAHDSRQ